MNQFQFKKLRMTGQLCGGLIFAICIALMFTQQNGLFFLAGFLIFWAINYPLIHVFIGNRFVNGQHSAHEDTQQSNQKGNSLLRALCVFQGK